MSSQFFPWCPSHLTSFVIIFHSFISQMFMHWEYSSDKKEQIPQPLIEWKKRQTMKKINIYHVLYVLWWWVRGKSKTKKGHIDVLCLPVLMVVKDYLPEKVVPSPQWWEDRCCRHGCSLLRSQLNLKQLPTRCSTPDQGTVFLFNMLTVVGAVRKAKNYRNKDNFFHLFCYFK